MGDEADASDVLVAIGPAVTEVLREVGAYDVAVEDLDPAALVEQPLLDAARDRGLAGRWQAGEPHRESGVEIACHVAAHSPSPTSALKGPVSSKSM